MNLVSREIKKDKEWYPYSYREDMETDVIPSSIKQKITVSRCLPFLKTGSYLFWISQCVWTKSTKSTTLNSEKPNYYKSTLTSECQLRPYLTLKSFTTLPHLYKTYTLRTLITPRLYIWHHPTYHGGGLNKDRSSSLILK